MRSLALVVAALTLTALLARPVTTDAKAPTGQGSGPTVAHTAVDLNLRAGASLYDEVILVMPAGAEIYLVGGVSINGFVQVLYGQTIGWAYADYIVYEGAPPLRVSVDLNLRTGPSLGAGIILVMTAGSTVYATGDGQNGFLPVSYDGIAGWAYADYLIPII